MFIQECMPSVLTNFEAISMEDRLRMPHSNPQGHGVEHKHITIIFISNYKTDAQGFCMHVTPTSMFFFRCVFRGKRYILSTRSVRYYKDGRNKTGTKKFNFFSG